MTLQEKDNLFYLCTLIEFIGRKTRNHRSYIVKSLGKEGIEKQLYDAEVNHCLSFDQVSDEISDFRTGVYFENMSYLQCSYESGYLLD